MGNKGVRKDQTAGIAARFRFHKIEKVECSDEGILTILFEEGVEKTFDTARLIGQIPCFEQVYNDPSLLRSVRSEQFGIVWNDETDCSADYLWDAGETVKTAFTGLLSMKDATERWGINESTIRKAIAAGRFEIGIDVQKFGKQWVLTKGSVEREYGPELADIREDMVYPEHVMKRITSI